MLFRFKFLRKNNHSIIKFGIDMELKLKLSQLHF